MLLINAIDVAVNAELVKLFSSHTLCVHLLTATLQNMFKNKLVESNKNIFEIF